MVRTQLLGSQNDMATIRLGSAALDRRVASERSWSVRARERAVDDDGDEEEAERGEDQKPSGHGSPASVLLSVYPGTALLLRHAAPHAIRLVSGQSMVAAIDDDGASAAHGLGILVALAA